MIDWFKKVYRGIQKSNDSKYINEIAALKVMIKGRETIIYALKKECDNLLEEHKISIKTILDLLSKVEELKKGKTSELENYWNNKIKPSTTIQYGARRDTGKTMNVIRFFNEENDKVPILKGKTNDINAILALKKVRSIIKYTQKKDKEHNGEYWQWANETFELGTGDCEDGSILMANIMLKSGIPYWRVRINAGTVKNGGHAYITYLREKDNKWIVLDWCYYYKPKGILWTEAKKYFGIWFSFNQKYGFKKAVLDRKPKGL